MSYSCLLDCDHDALKRLDLGRGDLVKLDGVDLVLSLVSHRLLDLLFHDTKLAKRSSYLVPWCSCQSRLNCHKMSSEGRVLGQNPVPRSRSMESLYLL